MKAHALLPILILITGCTANIVKIQTANTTIIFNVDIADDETGKEQGLMYRESLDENKGMLFVYQDETIRTFWMKNTKIPLDIIFIDKELEILKITEAEPCTTQICEFYSSENPAKYVLEINKGISKKYGIKEGNKISLQK